MLSIVWPEISQPLPSPRRETPVGKYQLERYVMAALKRAWYACIPWHAHFEKILWRHAARQRLAAPAYASDISLKCGEA